MKTAQDDKLDPIERLAARIVKWATASHVLVLIFAIIGLWAILGPKADFSESWQSSMIVPVTVITFLLVFFILRAQNKDTRAIQLKLNEIIAALAGANNELIDVENKSEQQLEAIHQRYETVAQNIDKLDGEVTDSIVVMETVEEIEADAQTASAA